MRKHFHVVVIAISLFGFASGALAWDFSLPSTFVSSIHYRNRPTLAALSDDSLLQDSSAYSRTLLPYSATNKLTFRPTLTVWDSIKLSGVFSLEGNDTRFPDPVITGEHVSMNPSTPPFQNYYHSLRMPVEKVEPRTGKMEQLWLTAQSYNTTTLMGMGLMVGTRDLPFGVGASMGNNDPHQILAGVFRGGPVTVVLGTGAKLPAAYGRTRSVPALPYGPLRLAGSWAGHFAVEQAPPLVGATALALPGYVLALPLDLALSIILSPLTCLSSENNSPKFIPLFTSIWSALLFGSDEDNHQSSLLSQVLTTDEEGHLTVPPFIRTTEDMRNSYQLYDDSAIPFDMLLVKYTEGPYEGGFAVIHYPYPTFGVPFYASRLHAEVDDKATQWMIYAAYTNDVAFAHAELSRYGWDIYPFGGGHDYRKGYHMFTECGLHVGPATASLMYAFASGTDLSQSNEKLRHDPYPIRNQATERYESLMFNTFGGGNMAFEGPAGQRQGMMSDAYAIGARLDYALSANLNIWSSYLWAHRWERNGTRFGQYAGAGRLATPLERYIFAQKAGRALVAGPDNYGYVSDGSIGWEMNLGANWRVIQDLDLNVRGSYWQPGGWFREAYLGNTLQKGGHLNPQVIDNPKGVTGLTCSLSFQF